MARGDLLIVDLPVPSGRSGREQIGQRPAIVVQTDVTDENLPTTMIVPLTSRLEPMRFPHTLCIDPSPENGLEKKSVLLVFQLRAIDKKRLARRIGCLDQEHLQKLEKEMRALLDL